MDKVVKRKHDNKLTIKQEDFCQYYIVHKNATEAAIKAGYSVKTSAVIATQNLRKLNVKLRIEELLRKQQKRIEVKADNVIREIAKLAFVSMKSYVENGILKPDSELTDDEMAAIVQWDQTQVSEEISCRKIKLHDKLGALDKLCRHLGLYKEKDASTVIVNVSVPIGELEKKDRESRLHNLFEVSNRLNAGRN